MRPEKGPRLDIILVFIALLSAFLNIYGIWLDMYANAYYTAAVTSMLQSWHNFFFASLDPAGFITIDKPPLVFWIQTLFAHYFGVRGWSVILPQALAGIGSVLLIYVLVKPHFGITAARFASLIMACSPIAVAVSRTNNIDSMLVFTLLAGTWMLFQGIHSQKPAWVIGAFAMIGAGFNMKMLQAYLVVPAFYLFYLLAYKSKWMKKLAVILAATLTLLIISLSWAVTVDSIPQDSRPYIGGSKTNSVLELAVGYNGMQRLTGMNRGGNPGAGSKDPIRSNQVPNRNNEASPLDDNMSSRGDAIYDKYMTTGNAPSGEANMIQNYPPRSGGYMPQGAAPGGYNGLPGVMPNPGNNAPQSRGMGGGSFGTGQAGPLRLFQSELSGQISWLLPLTGFACIALLAGIRRRKPLVIKENETIFWMTWLLTGVVFFSVAGFFHHYYLIMLAPPIAVLAGAGWVEMEKLYRNREGWLMWLLPSAMAFTAGFEIYVLKPYAAKIGVPWIIGLGVAGAVIVLLLSISRKRARLASLAATAGMLVLLAAPLYWAATPIIYGDNSQLPQAGPGQNGMGQGQGNKGIDNFASVNGKLMEYLNINYSGEKYFLMTSDASTAEAYIITTKQAVVAMGGFSDSDPALTIEKLEEIVSKKEVKYFLISSSSDNRGGASNNEVLNWIRTNSTEIPREEWQDSSAAGGAMGRDGQKTLYKINQ